MKLNENKFFSHLVILVFLALYCIFGFVTYKSYGITADEEIEYKSGKVLLNYFINGKTEKNPGISERQLPEKSTYYRGYSALLSALNPRGYYEWYHLLNILFSSIIFIFAYYLLLDRYNSTILALMGPISLLLTPRFFGDIPANPKDTPFAIFYFLSICAIFYFGKRKTTQIQAIIIIGILFGITQSLRAVGLTIYIIYIVNAVIFNTHTLNLKKLAKELILILIISCAISFASWPYLQKGFPQSITHILKNTSNFDKWNGKIFYEGQYLLKDQRPTSYLFTWLLITTPLYSLIFSAFSLVYIVKKRDNLLMLLISALALNLFLYIILKPVIYNGLRHFLYLTPIIAIIGAITFLDVVVNARSKGTKLILFFLVGANLINIFLSMLKLHPYEYIYFNETISFKDARTKYEMDYWGSSYKEATEWLRANKSEKEKVYVCNLSFAAQYYSKGSLKVVPSTDQADYIICDYENDNSGDTTGKVIHTISRYGVPLNVIRQK